MGSTRFSLLCFELLTPAAMSDAPRRVLARRSGARTAQTNRGHVHRPLKGSGQCAPHLLVHVTAHLTATLDTLNRPVAHETGGLLLQTSENGNRPTDSAEEPLWQCALPASENAGNSDLREGRDRYEGRTVSYYSQVCNF